MSERAPAVVFNWVPLALDEQQAKELQRDLLALIRRYQQHSEAPTHLLGLFLTPARF
jgi:hypothetical protein